MTSLAMFSAMANRLGLASATPGGDQAQGGPGPELQPDPGTVEAGLAAFAAKWNGAGPVLAATRFGRFVVNKTFNCHVADSPRAWSLTLGPTGASLSPGRDPTAHADVVLEESDWLDVLGGEFTGLAPVLAGRAYPRKDEANSTVTLLLVMFVAAHLPAKLDGDPRFTEELVRGFFQRGGLPECEGEPPSLDTLARLQEDPEGTLSEPTLAPNDVPNLTRELASWVHGLSYEDIPDEQIQQAKHQLKTILGVSYAGTTMGPASTLREEVEDWSEPGDATVIGASTFQTSPKAAAYANSFLSQALEWEDWSNLAHSGSAVVPVALAAAEDADRTVTGEELLTAIVAGNEILARLGGVMTDILHAGQTLPVHQIEAPLVAGKVLGLDEDELADAVGIAATQPQLTSLPAWTAGAKGLIGAEPVGASMRAVELAQAGLSGRRDQLENPLGYIYRLSDVRHPRDVQRALEDLPATGSGGAWVFREATHFDKKYPVDGFTLTAVDATLDARADLSVDPRDPGQIESIRVHQNLPLASTGTMYRDGYRDGPAGDKHVLDRVLDPNLPDWTYTSLLFDGRYPLLAALIDGQLTNEHYTRAWMSNHRSQLLALWDNVYAAPDLSMGIFGAQVEVTAANGPPITSRIGAPEQADHHTVGCIEDVDPDAKFHETAGTVIGKAQRDRVLAAIDDLESTTATGLASRL